MIGPIAVGDAKLYVDGFKAGGRGDEPVGQREGQLHGLVQRRRAGFYDLKSSPTTAKSFVSQNADVLTGSSQTVVGAITV